MKTLATKSEIFKAAHKLTKETRKATDSYSATFSICLKYIYSQSKNTKMEQVEKTTTTVRYLKIDWKNKRMQANAKNNGFVWNGTKKLWEHKSRKAIEVPNHYEIIAYVYNPADNSEVGNFGTGCETTRYKADKYGYDAIEN